MTTFALPNLDGGGVVSDISLSGGKIIQRIPPARLSESVKPSRMADADAAIAALPPGYAPHPSLLKLKADAGR